MDTLPPEVRFEILKHLVPTHANLSVSPAFSPQAQFIVDRDNRADDFVGRWSCIRLSNSIFRISTVIRNDALEMLYGMNKIFLPPDHIRQFKGTVGSVNLGRIQDLVFEADVYTTTSDYDLQRFHRIIAVKPFEFVNFCSGLKRVLICGIGKGIKSNACEPHTGCIRDLDTWVKPHYEIIRAIVKAPTNLRNGRIFCHVERCYTKICQCGDSAVPTDDEFEVHIDEMNDDRFQVVRPKGGKAQGKQVKRDAKRKRYEDY